MKKVFISVAVIIMCLALSGGLSHSAEKVITLEFSDWTPVIDPVAALLDQWCADVEKQTNGRVKINHHPGGTLTPPNQTYDAVVNGIVDVGMGPLGITAGKFPLMEVMDLPLGLKSSYMATRLANQVVKQFKPKELSDVKVLYLDTAPPSYVTTKKPVRNLEDLQGLKIRALSPVSVKGLKLLGAVPLVIPPSDLYDGLQKGVVDGTIGPILILSVMKIADVAHYTTLNMNSSLVGSGYLVMNKQKWESLPPDIQQVFDKLSVEYADKKAKLLDKQCDDTLASVKTKGHTFINLSKAEEDKWANKLAPVYDDYVKEKSAKGIPAADVLKYARDWVKTNQK